MSSRRYYTRYHGICVWLGAVFGFSGASLDSIYVVSANTSSIDSNGLYIIQQRFTYLWADTISLYHHTYRSVSVYLIFESHTSLWVALHSLSDIHTRSRGWVRFSYRSIQRSLFALMCLAYGEVLKNVKYKLNEMGFLGIYVEEKAFYCKIILSAEKTVWRRACDYI